MGTGIQEQEEMGNKSYAYILISYNDIQHVGFWARDMGRQHRPNDIDDSLHQFSTALPFSYAHLAGENCFLSCLERVMMWLAQSDAVMYVIKKYVC